MYTKLVTAPAARPVTAAQCRSHSRIDDTNEDTLLEGFIDAAVLDAERYTARQFVTATYDLFLDSFPAHQLFLEIPKPPLQSVTSIQYYDSAGSLQTWSTDEYRVDANRLVGRVRLVDGYAWPDTENGRDGAVIVRFVAGYGDAEDVPADLLLAIKLMVDHRYDADRGSSGWDSQNVTIGRAVGSYPEAVYRQLDGRKVHTLCFSDSD